MPDEGDPGFLAVTPPHWASRGLAYLLIGLFAAAAVAAVVIRIPETVSSRFVLVPVQGVDQVRASRDGIVAAIRATEAQAVGQGEPLFVIRSPAIGDRSAELRALETQMQGAAERLANERRRDESQRRADEEEERRLRGRFAHLGQKLEEQRALQAVRQARFRATLAIYENDIEITKREIEFKQQYFAVTKELADRAEKYHKEGIVSWVEYNTRKLEAGKLAIDLQQLDRQLDSGRLKVTQLKIDEERDEIDWKLALDQMLTERREVQTSIDKLRHESDARRSAFGELERSLREETDKATIRAAALRAELGESRGNELAVAAPCAGSVLRLWAQRPGAVVKEGEPLADLACAGGGLQAELTVPPAAVGQIRPGQRVKLLYDTFPYQRHGVRYGTVRWVSPASVGVSFRVFADVEDEAIAVKGERRRLTAGMGGRAEVLTGRQSLLAYAVEPIRRLRENLAEPPPR